MSIRSKSLSVLFLIFLVSAAAGAGPIDFHLQDLDGNTVRLADYRGKWVIVNFWATWCGPCLQEMPELNRFYRQRKDRVVVLGINFEQIESAPLAEFVDKMALEYPVLRIGDQPLAPFEPLKGLPSTFVLSPEGDLTASRLGLIDEEWLKTAIGE